METWAGLGEVGALSPSDWGLLQLTHSCLLLFRGWGSVGTALKGKPLRFISLKDTSPDDLEGSQLQVALCGVMAKHRLGTRQPGFSATATIHY